MAMASIFMLLFASMFFIGLFFVIVNTIMIIVWKIRKRRNKNPKKWWFMTSIIGLIVSILVTLFPIGYIGSSIYERRTREKEDDRFEKVIEALEKKDKDALKAVFSKQALSDADDFDRRLDYLFDFFQGTVESWEKTGHGGGSSIGGGTTEYWDLFYTVITKKNVYRFYLLTYPVDTFNSDNVGLYTLRVVKKEDEDKVRGIKPAGVYVPDLDGENED